MKTFNLSSSTSIPQMVQQYICMYIYICLYMYTGNLSNCHCLAKAVNQIAGALFTIHGPGDVSDRLQEFLAVSLPPPPLLPKKNPPKKPTNYRQL